MIVQEDLAREIFCTLIELGADRYMLKEDETVDSVADKLKAISSDTAHRILND